MKPCILRENSVWAQEKQKISGTKAKYRVVKKDDYMLCDSIHDTIIDEDTWCKVQEKRKTQAKRYEHINKDKDKKTYLLSGLLLCPICDADMYGNKSTKNKNGKHYKYYFYYGCKHRNFEQ